MKQFKEILQEFYTDRIPMRKRMGVNGARIFCPHCGQKFTYYKEKVKCRYCDQDLVIPRQEYCDHEEIEVTDETI